jgi:hypothetical protein
MYTEIRKLRNEELRGIGQDHVTVLQYGGFVYLTGKTRSAYRISDGTFFVKTTLQDTYSFWGVACLGVSQMIRILLLVIFVNSHKRKIDAARSLILLLA